MQRVGILFLLGLAVLAAGWGLPAMAAGEGPYHYLTAEGVKARLERREPLNLLDIQVEKDFARQHLPGAVATFAYPVKSEDERGRLDAVLPQLQANADPVLIVCPRGEGGAKRTYEHLLARGIAPERLYILEKGQEGWPYPELTENAGN